MVKPYYQDDYCTIYNADCRKILPFLEPVDLVLADPPYGINENDKKVASRGKLANCKDYWVFNWDKKLDLTLSWSQGKYRTSIVEIATNPNPDNIPTGYFNN